MKQLPERRFIGLADEPEQIFIGVVLVGKQVGDDLNYPLKLGEKFQTESKEIEKKSGPVTEPLFSCIRNRYIFLLVVLNRNMPQPAGNKGAVQLTATPAIEKRLRLLLRFHLTTQAVNSLQHPFS